MLQDISWQKNVVFIIIIIITIIIIIIMIITVVLFVKTLFMKHPRFMLLHTNLYIVQLK